MGADRVRILLVLAGVGQLVLSAASFAIPRVMGWREGLAGLRPIYRQMFWNYAGYILVSNVAFGLLSAFAPGWLLDGSPLAIAVSAYIALYWGARVLVQFFYFDRTEAAANAFTRLAEAALVALFAYLTIVYTLVAARGAGA